MLSVCAYVRSTNVRPKIKLLQELHEPPEQTECVFVSRYKALNTRPIFFEYPDLGEEGRMISAVRAGKKTLETR